MDWHLLCSLITLFQYCPECQADTVKEHCTGSPELWAGMEVLRVSVSSLLTGTNLLLVKFAETV